MKNAENKKGLSVVLMIPAIIIGAALYKQFDFENLEFENPALATVYSIAIAISIIFLINDTKKRLKKQKTTSDT